MGKKFSFIGEEKGSELLVASTSVGAQVEVTTEKKNGEKVIEMLILDEFMDVKGWKVLGNRLSQDKVKKVVLKSEKVGEAPVVVRKMTAVVQDSDADSDGGSEAEDNIEGDDNGTVAAEDAGTVKPESNGLALGSEKSGGGTVILGGDGSPQLNLL